MTYAANADDTNFVIREMFEYSNDKTVMGTLLLKDEQKFLIDVYKKLYDADSNTKWLTLEESFNNVKPHFKKCIDTLVMVGAVCRLKTPDGASFISGRDISSLSSDEVTVHHYRPHHGSLDESMAKQMPFCFLDDLQTIISNQFDDSNGDFESNYVRFDERVNWETFMLTNQDIGGVLGFTNVNPNTLPQLIW